MKYQIHDTIAAIATPHGMGAIAVLRLSGKDSFNIIQNIFRTPKNKTKDFSKVKTQTIHFGTLNDAENIVDEVLVSVFRNPHSYTGEDVVEISCHGSPFIQKQILQLLLKCGARLANPGEFTLRAFLNGKLDLSQAEAVAELIASDNESRHRIAMQQMRGGFSNELKLLREQLINFASLIELELDFAEEDVEFADRNQLIGLIKNIESKVKRLIASFDMGHVIKEGIPVVIAGKPNVGKSTLLNALLNEERAIVSDIAGTTRDTIEEDIHLNGLHFRFIDTAGIRETIDAIEKIGVQKAYEKIGQSAVVLYMIDASETSAEELTQIIHDIRFDAGLHPPVIIPVVNKCDVTNALLTKAFEQFENVLFISAKNNEHVDEVKNALLDKINASQLKQDSSIIVNARHLDALQKTNEQLQLILDGIEAKVSSEYLATDLRLALYHLGLITGEITTEDLLGNIFSKFCIGK